MKFTKSQSQLIEAAKAAGSMIEETTVMAMVSHKDASTWNQAERLLLFADGTVITVAPDNTRRRIRTIKEMKSIVGLA